MTVGHHEPDPDAGDGTATTDPGTFPAVRLPYEPMSPGGAKPHGGSTAAWRYHGHRRVDDSIRPRVFAAVAVLVGIGTVVAVALALASPAPSGGGPAAGGSESSTGAGAVPVGSDLSTQAPSSPSPKESRRPTASGSPSQPPGPSPTRFEPVTYEAEAATNTLTGSARVADYTGASGGKIVRNIGNWSGPGPSGTLRFAVTVPAAGRYSLTFFHVYLNDDPTRTAVIRVGRAEPVTVTVTGGSTCCATKMIVVDLIKGANTITFANPDGHAPSIDKIVIGSA
jgi:hypothetical protein